jgi:ribosomal-protein-alanine N-acetyltransferase
MHNKDFVYFQMVDKETGLLIGACGFHNWSVQHRRSEMGYGLNTEPYKRKGFMTEALRFLLPYGFSVLLLNRIEAITRPHNSASVKLLLKFNFQQEGLLRQHVFNQDAMEDSLIFSLLKQEFDKA